MTDLQSTLSDLGSKVEAFTAATRGQSAEEILAQMRGNSTSEERELAELNRLGKYMKPNELMIGDLVYSPFHCERVRITGVMEHGNLCYVESLKGTDFYSKEANVNDFEPIEIDAEMLMQNGFREDRPGITYRYRKTGETTIDMVDVFFHNNGETTVGVNQTTDGAYDTSVNCHCKYVHELQHVLRLCGIIKQLKLG